MNFLETIHSNFHYFYYGPVNRLAQGISALLLVEMRFSKLSVGLSPALSS